MEVLGSVGLLWRSVETAALNLVGRYPPSRFPGVLPKAKHTVYAKGRHLRFGYWFPERHRFPAQENPEF
jgi:hypothetical protein